MPTTSNQLKYGKQGHETLYEIQMCDSAKQRQERILEIQFFLTVPRESAKQIHESISEIHFFKAKQRHEGVSEIQFFCN